MSLWNAVTLNTSCVVVSESFSRNSEVHKCSCAQCSLFFGWVPLICLEGRVNLDAGGPMHEECAIAVQEEPNLHLSSSWVMSQMMSGHLRHFLLLSVK